jgi:hypothetical protein
MTIAHATIDENAEKGANENAFRHRFAKNFWTTNTKATNAEDGIVMEPKLLASFATVRNCQMSDVLFKSKSSPRP